MAKRSTERLHDILGPSVPRSIVAVREFLRDCLPTAFWGDKTAREHQQTNAANAITTTRFDTIKINRNKRPHAQHLLQAKYCSLVVSSHIPQEPAAVRHKNTPSPTVRIHSPMSSWLTPTLFCGVHFAGGVVSSITWSRRSGRPYGIIVQVVQGVSVCVVQCHAKPPSQYQP